MLDGQRRLHRLLRLVSWPLFARARGPRPDASSLSLVSAKTAVYAFLIERLRIVQPVRKRRRDSKLYKVCFGLLSPLIALLFIMLFGRIHDVDGNNVCRFGLQRHASFLVLGYDLTMITVLTSAFIWPLMRGRGECESFSSIRVSRSSCTLPDPIPVLL